MLVLAAECHELGFLEWDLEPTLDPGTGGPTSVKRMDPADHLPLQQLGPERLAARSEYAALLSSLHHAAAYETPHPLALMRRRHRLVHRYLNNEAARQRVLRSKLQPDPVQLEHDWRLVHAWDAISHTLLLDRAPRRLGEVPTQTTTTEPLTVRRAGETFTVDPWPFRSDRVTTAVRGRLLDRTYEDRAEMLTALQQAPEVRTDYRLAPP